MPNASLADLRESVAALMLLCDGTLKGENSTLLFKALAPENSPLKYPAGHGYQIDRLVELAASHADDLRLGVINLRVKPPFEASLTNLRNALAILFAELALRSGYDE
jgi:hypothetical protein